MTPATTGPSTPMSNVPFYMTLTLQLPPPVTQAMTPDRHMSTYHMTSAAITPSSACPFIEQTANFIIPENKLHQLRAQAVTNTPTHFCVILMIYSFPELFGDENQRFKFNVGGVREENRLDSVRVAAIRRYVTAYFPEMVDIRIWTVKCVKAMNERLCRRA